MSVPFRMPTALAVSGAAHGALLGALLLVLRPAPARSAWTERLLPLPAEATEVRIVSAGPRDAAPGPRRTVTPASAHRASPGRQLSAGAQEEAAPVLSLAAMSTAEGMPAVGRFTSAAKWAPSGEGAATGTTRVAGDPRLEELHRRLAEAAVRCYPASARRLRLTGEVPLHFCLDAGGTATELDLEGSTGSALLDRSALECVVPGAAPLPGVEGCFLVPVHFGG